MIISIHAFNNNFCIDNSELFALSVCLFNYIFWCYWKSDMLKCFTEERILFLHLQAHIQIGITISTHLIHSHDYLSYSFLHSCWVFIYSWLYLFMALLCCLFNGQIGFPLACNFWVNCFPAPTTAPSRNQRRKTNLKSLE